MNEYTYAEIMDAIFDDLKAKNKPAIEYVRQKEGDKFLKELKRLIKHESDLETFKPYRIVDECKYPFDYKCDYFKTKIRIAVNQTENGGYSGDSYSGEFYVMLPRSKKYFVFAYSM